MKAYFVYLTKPSNKTPDRIAGVRLLAKYLQEFGYDRSLCKSVYLVAGEWGTKKPSSDDIKANQARFLEEIGTEPCILVAMGASAITPLTKGEFPISDCRGEPVPVTEKMPYPKGSLVYGLHDPAQVWCDAGIEDLFKRDIRHLVALMKGMPEQNPTVENMVVHTAEEVDHFADVLPLAWGAVPEGERFLVVDTETHGKNWMDPDRYIRTVQIGYAPGMALTVELYKENPAFSDPNTVWPRKAETKKEFVKDLLKNPECCCPDMEKMWKALRKLLQDSRYPIIGHNVIY